jgi:hypothetical protein
MLEYRISARLRAYVSGVFPTKNSELDNDVPFLEAIPQELTESQKRQLIDNQDTIRILSENFVRYDLATELTPEQQKQARVNIDTLNAYDICAKLNELENKLQTNINIENQERVSDVATINEILGPDTSLINFDLENDTVTRALNEARQRINDLADNTTTIYTSRTGAEFERLKAVAISDTVDSGMERHVTPQDVVNIERRIKTNEDELERITAKGGYLTPFDFGWDIITTSASIGNTFNEDRDGVKTLITIVYEGGDYPTGTNINASDAKVKAQQAQTALTNWATQDIWSESYHHYGEDPFPVILKPKTRITVHIDKGINPDLPDEYWLSVGYIENGTKVGCWIKNSVIKFGLFDVYDELIHEYAVAFTFTEIDEWATDVFNYDVDDELGYIAFDESVSSDPEIDSGLDLYNTFLYWSDEHQPSNIFNGTRVVNVFNNWIWELTNTPNTNPPVFNWGVADISEENIGLASYTMSGVVKTGIRYSDDSNHELIHYGVMLDKNNRMEVDGLGSDLLLKEDKSMFGNSQQNGDPATMEKSEDSEYGWQVVGLKTYEDDQINVKVRLEDGYGFVIKSSETNYDNGGLALESVFSAGNDIETQGYCLGEYGVKVKDRDNINVSEKLILCRDKDNIPTVALLRADETLPAKGDLVHDQYGLARKGDIFQMFDTELTELYEYLETEGWIESST